MMEGQLRALQINTTKLHNNFPPRDSIGSMSAASCECIIRIFPGLNMEPFSCKLGLGSLVITLFQWEYCLLRGRSIIRAMLLYLEWWYAELQSWLITPNIKGGLRQATHLSGPSQVYEVWEQNVAVLIGLAAVMSFWIKSGELRPQSPVRDPLETFSQCTKVGKATG